MTLWRPFQTEAVSRRAVWERNLRLVARHNLEASVEKRGFTLELNHLADMVRRSFGLGGVGSEVGAAPSFFPNTCVPVPPPLKKNPCPHVHLSCPPSRRPMKSTRG